MNQVLQISYYCFNSNNYYATIIDLSGANSSTKSKKKRRFTLSMSGAFESANSQQSSKDFTIEALVAVIQEPDTGVPRALTGALEDVKIHRGRI